MRLPRGSHEKVVVVKGEKCVALHKSEAKGSEGMILEG